MPVSKEDAARELAYRLRAARGRQHGLICRIGSTRNPRLLKTSTEASSVLQTNQDVSPCAVIVLHWERRLRTPPRADADRTVTWGADRPDIYCRTCGRSVQIDPARLPPAPITEHYRRRLTA